MWVMLMLNIKITNVDHEVEFQGGTIVDTRCVKRFSTNKQCLSIMVPMVVTRVSDFSFLVISPPLMDL